MAKNEKYEKLAQAILQEVGGKENVINVMHCMTRLRFNLKDESLVNKENLKNVSGVMGAVNSGGQLQIVIGQTVDEVYDVICTIGNFAKEERINETIGAPKQKLTPKVIGSNILASLSACVTPLIPMMMAASMFKVLVALLGPSLLGVLPETGSMYKLFEFVGDAGFYFIPITIGYTASKHFKVTPVIGMMIGAALIHPTFMAMIDSGEAFSVFGIPAPVQNYASSIFPAILSVWIMSYIERFFKKILPTILRTIFAPFLTILVMLPIAFCVLAPAGGFIGTYISGALVVFSNYGGIAQILAMGIIAALWEFLVISGMHVVLLSTLMVSFMTNGSDTLVLPCGAVASLAAAGMCLGGALRIKNKEERSLSVGYFIASIIGGVTEPGLYGMGFKHRRPFIGLLVGGFAGGLYAGIAKVTAYALVPSASFLGLLSFAGGPLSNFINGVIAGVIGFAVSVVATYILGFKKESPFLTSAS